MLKQLLLLLLVAASNSSQPRRTTRVGPSVAYAMPSRPPPIAPRPATTTSAVAPAPLTRTPPGRMRAPDGQPPPARAREAPGVPDRAGGGPVESEAASNSPLWMITQKAEVTNLITYLQQSRLPIEQQPDAPHELHFSRRQIDGARAEFEATLREGEQKQHTLCQLLGQRLLGTYYLQSVVVGELPRTRHRFELSQRVQPTTLRSETDLALGNRVLAQHRVMSNGVWVAPNLVASFVEYQPTVARDLSSVVRRTAARVDGEGAEREEGAAPGEGGVDEASEETAPSPRSCALTEEVQIYKMISRIKAEQEIFNKVCDEIFDFDRLVRDLSREDKQLASLGHFVKDVFGIKLVVGTPEQARELQTAIENLRFTDDELAGVRVGAADAKSLRFIEVKDHLGSLRKGNSGWECIKSVFEWNGSLFEVQIQPLINYCLERERLTKQSHDAFKQKRERARDQVAERVPLFGFYRDILRTLFVEVPACGGLTMPAFKNVLVSVSD